MSGNGNPNTPPPNQYGYYDATGLFIPHPTGTQPNIDPQTGAAWGYVGPQYGAIGGYVDPQYGAIGGYVDPQYGAVGEYGESEDEDVESEDESVGKYEEEPLRGYFPNQNINPPSGNEVQRYVYSKANPATAMIEGVEHDFRRYVEKKNEVEDRMREMRWRCKQKRHYTILKYLNELRKHLRTLRDFEDQMKTNVIYKTRIKSNQDLQHSQNLLQRAIVSLQQIDKELGKFEDIIEEREANPEDTGHHWGVEPLPKVRVKPEMRTKLEPLHYYQEIRAKEGRATRNNVTAKWRQLYQRYGNSIAQFYVRLSDFERTFRTGTVNLDIIYLDDRYRNALTRLKKKMYKALWRVSSRSFDSINDNIENLEVRQVMIWIHHLGEALEIVDNHTAEMERLREEFNQRAGPMALRRKWDHVQPERWGLFGRPHVSRLDRRRQDSL